MVHYNLNIFPFRITHYLGGGDTLRLCTYPVFCLSTRQLILASINESYLRQLLWWFSISLMPSTFISWNSSIRKNGIFLPICLQLYGIMDMYFILWVRVQDYFDLCFCSTCSSLGHWELFWVDSSAFLICPYPFFLFSSFLSFLLRVDSLPLCEQNVWPNMGLEIGPSASEEGLMDKDILLQNFQHLGLAKDITHTQKHEFPWFPFLLSPLSSPFLGH